MENIFEIMDEFIKSDETNFNVPEPDQEEKSNDSPSSITNVSLQEYDVTVMVSLSGRQLNPQRKIQRGRQPRSIIVQNIDS